MGIVLASFYPAHTQETASALPLFDGAKEGVESRFVPSSPQVTMERSRQTAVPGVIVTIQPGADAFPGVTLKPENGAVWDLSAYGHIEARIVNLGAETLSVSLRVDNEGDWQLSPWSTESFQIKPGATETIKVIFGYSFGKAAYALKPAAISKLLLFTKKSEMVQSFRIEQLQAAGPAGEKLAVDPKSIRVKPKNGLVLGSGVAIDAAKQIEAKGSALATVGDDQSVTVTQPATAKEESFVRLKPAVGRWDLRDGGV